MDFAFPLPFSQGEWLAWISAAVTVVYGLIAFLSPRMFLRMLGLDPAEGQQSYLTESRAQLGGFYIGLGVAAILFAQPLIYVALGLGWGMAAIGRLISMLFDRALSLRNMAFCIISLLISAFPLAYAFGIIA